LAADFRPIFDLKQPLHLNHHVFDDSEIAQSVLRNCLGDLRFLPLLQIISTPAATVEQFEVYLYIVQTVKQERSLYLSVPTDLADGFRALL
jgi:hypothetical protein